jgi:hypothetical protein
MAVSLSPPRDTPIAGVEGAIGIGVLVSEGVSVGDDEEGEGGDDVLENMFDKPARPGLVDTGDEEDGVMAGAQVVEGDVASELDVLAKNDSSLTEAFDVALAPEAFDGGEDGRFGADDVDAATAFAVGGEGRADPAAGQGGFSDVGLDGAEGEGIGG